MENERSLDNDLSIIVKDFHQLQKFHLEEQRLKTDLQHVLKTLKEEIHSMKATEKTERFKLHECHNLIAQQQETINKFFDLKEENRRLLEHSSELEEAVASLKAKLTSEGTNHKLKWNEITQEYEQKLKRLRESLKQEVQSLKHELELARVEIQRISSESALKLETLQDEKIEEMNITVEIYEDKVSKLEKILAESRAENQHIMEHAAANIAIYRKRIMDLEEASSFNLTNQLPHTSNNTVKFHDLLNYRRLHNNTKESYNSQIVNTASREKDNPWQAIMCSTADVTKFPFVPGKPIAIEVSTDIVKKRKTIFPAVKKRKLFTHTDSID